MRLFVRRLLWCVTRFVTPRDDAFEYTNTTTLHMCATATDSARFVYVAPLSFLRASRRGTIFIPSPVRVGFVF